jgi:hypothetical protein
MVNDDDIVELLVDTLKEDAWKDAVSAKKKAGVPSGPKYTGFFLKEKFINSSTTLPKGKKFLTEYEVKQMIKGGAREITVSANAIISPLAQELLEAKGIKVARR